MKTKLIIVCGFILVYAALPQRSYAQAKATATISATVIPSVSLELKKPNIVATIEESSSRAMNFRGTGNVLVVVDSKDVKSTNIFQLTTEKPTTVNIPSPSKQGKTSITYLSS